MRNDAPPKSVRANPRRIRCQIRDVAAALRVLRPLRGRGTDTFGERRQLLSDLLRLVVTPANVGHFVEDPVDGHPRRLPTAEGSPPRPDGSKLPPRLAQTLQLLLNGDSEKQVAQRMDLSPHTVHVYVKKLYRRFEVRSRAELLALHVRR